MVSPSAPIEFVITAPGYATARSTAADSRAAATSSTCAQNAWPTADNGADSVVTLARPRGYLDPARDKMLLDGAVPAGVPAGTVWGRPRSSPRGACAVLRVNSMANAWWGRPGLPPAAGHLVFLELTY